MDKRYYVYTWNIPNTNTPFYVGKGTLTRATNFHESGRCENKRQKLLKKGYSNDQIVKMVKVNLTEEEALTLEEKLINKFKRIEDGGTLLNYKIVNQRGFKIIDPSILNYIINLYVNKKYSAKTIGKIVKLHETSVLRYLRIAGVKTFNRGSRFKFDQTEINKIIKLYLEGNSTIYIANLYECSVPTICILLKQNNISFRGRKKTKSLV